MRNRKITKRTAIIAAGLALGAALSMMLEPDAMAWPRYNDGCQDCHGAFTDGTSPFTPPTVFPSNNKHTMHRSSQNMNTDCDLCHLSGDGNNPYMFQSDGTNDTPGLGCIGCHGRDYGGDIGVSGIGLRLHHAKHDVTFCVGCHGDPAEDPLGEDVAPPYYGSPDTDCDDPCNAAPGLLENWSIGDTQGLDNDGDDAYDGADPDCVGCASDITGDGNVGTPDLLELLANWGNPYGTPDLLQLLADWGPC